MCTTGFYVILFMICTMITWPGVVDLVLVRTLRGWRGEGVILVSRLEKLTT
jgi:hypothetical protein